MMNSDRIPQDPVFGTTRWSAVLQAGRPGSPEAARALAELKGLSYPPGFSY
jgi:hypothetical protein